VKQASNNAHVRMCGLHTTTAHQQPRHNLYSMLIIFLKASSSSLDASVGVKALFGRCPARLLVWTPFDLPTGFGLTSSTKVANFTEPSGDISTRGVVPLMPIVATGVSIFISPVFATAPAINVNAPLTREKKLEFDVLFGLYTNSLSSIRALLETLNAVPS